MAMCTTVRDFFARQGDLTQEYFVYCESNPTRYGGKISAVWVYCPFYKT